MKKTIAIVTLFVAFGSTADAQTTPRADNREVAQQARIRQGRSDGELTSREASALHSEQRNVRRVERRAKADGEVTPKEKARLERKQDRASRHIRRAKNNNLDK